MSGNEGGAPRRRYCLTLKLDREADVVRIAEAGKAIVDLVKRWSKGEYELLASSGDYRLVSYVFVTLKAPEVMRADVERSAATRNADSFIILEIGDHFVSTGFSRAATWLQRHR